MSKSEIKVGDKVKLLKDLYKSNEYKKDTVHVVLSINFDGYFIRVNPDEPENGYLQQKFELVEPKKVSTPVVKKEETGWGF